ncbi:phosphotransferase enzyme family protein [Aminobacter anthyllidis]|uniref:Hydroxylysine kinase n=1 Tax=Aminobacter anthyllidis TaxID=1035067 RepID=A0A9X1AIS8_9HYPH|nr:phosphotransferase enzyme family protein [Aminobacter anthyllidis]MBT1160226.1 phosphotransferase enzyme family protein [Aminobacter anthyllidis]
MNKLSDAMMQRLLEESSLLSSSQSIDPLFLNNMLERHYGLSGRFERLGSEKGHTFRLKTGVNEYLVKVSPSDEPEQVTALQIAAMRYLDDAAHALPIQRIKPTLERRDSVPVDLGDGTCRTLSVFCFVEGLLWEQMDANVEQLTKVGDMLGRVNIALQLFGHPAAERSLVYDIRHFPLWAGLVDYAPDPKHRLLAQRVFRLFEEVVLPRLTSLEMQVIHGDYAPNNVVVDPHSEVFVTAILDFGDTVHSAVIFDPANTVAHLIGRSQDNPWEDAFAFVAGYEHSRPINQSELPLLPVAALARLTMLALIRYWKAERAPDQSEELLASAEYYWANLERAMGAPLDDVVARFRYRASDPSA